MLAVSLRVTLNLKWFSCFGPPGAGIIPHYASLQSHICHGQMDSYLFLCPLSWPSEIHCSPVMSQMWQVILNVTGFQENCNGTTTILSSDIPLINTYALKDITRDLQISLKPSLVQIIVAFAEMSSFTFKIPFAYWTHHGESPLCGRHWPQPREST